MRNTTPATYSSTRHGEQPSVFVTGTEPEKGILMEAASDAFELAQRLTQWSKPISRVLLGCSLRGHNDTPSTIELILHEPSSGLDDVQTYVLKDPDSAEKLSTLLASLRNAQANRLYEFPEPEELNGKKRFKMGDRVFVPQANREAVVAETVSPDRPGPYDYFVRWFNDGLVVIAGVQDSELELPSDDRTENAVYRELDRSMYRSRVFGTDMTPLRGSISNAFRGAAGFGSGERRHPYGRASMFGADAPVRLRTGMEDEWLRGTPAARSTGVTELDQLLDPEIGGNYNTMGVPRDAFAALQAKTGGYLNSACPGIDPALREIVKRINMLPGVTTVRSRAGRIIAALDTATELQIVFAVTPEGEGVLNSLASLLGVALCEVTNETVALKSLSLAWTFETVNLRGYIGCIPHATLSVRHNTTVTPKDVIAAFSHILGIGNVVTD